MIVYPNYKDEKEYPLERLLDIAGNHAYPLVYMKIEYYAPAEHPFTVIDDMGRLGDFDTLRDALIAIILRRINEASKSGTEEL